MCDGWLRARCSGLKESVASQGLLARSFNNGRGLSLLEGYRQDCESGRSANIRGDLGAELRRH